MPPSERKVGTSRIYIGILMCNCKAVKKMKAGGWLVPQLWSEKHCKRGM